MNHRNGWLRVNKSRPCPICERPDWCLLSTDGSAAICARIESARRCGESGWLHRLRDDVYLSTRRVVRSVSVVPSPSSSIDLAGMSAACQAAVRPEQLDHLAASLGLSVGSLHRLGIGWSTRYGAWTFPMQDTAGRIVGIRLPYLDGHKLSVRGGHEGLFLPAARHLDRRLLIAEGPTDTAALLDMAFPHVVGRPSCKGGVKLLIELVRQRQPEEVVIVADDDEPGQCGADYLASALAVYAPSVRVINPPTGTKDMRAWLQAGACRQDVERAIQAVPERYLTVLARGVRNRGH